MRLISLTAVLLALVPSGSVLAQATPFPGFSCATLANRQPLQGAPGMTFRVLKQTYAQNGAASIHRHQYGEIVYLLSGSGTNTMNGKTTPLSAEHAVVVPAGTLHHLSPSGTDTLTVLTVQFAGAKTPAWQPRDFKGPNGCHD